MSKEEETLSAHFGANFSNFCRRVFTNDLNKVAVGKKLGRKITPQFTLTLFDPKTDKRPENIMDIAEDGFAEVAKAVRALKEAKRSLLVRHSSSYPNKALLFQPR